MTTKPNILYINTHDTGRYLQPYGHAIATPHLQRLAEEGVLFRQAYCAAPTCSPSRAAMLTGQCSHSCGMLGLSHAGFALNDYRQHLIHTLRAHGYFCALSGVQHIDGPTVETATYAAHIGYDALLDLDDLTEIWSHPTTVARAEEFLRRAPAQPFYLEVGFGETHRPFYAPTEADDPRYALPPPVLPDTPATRREMAGFHASARGVDRKIGAVLQALDEAGLADNTLVIYTTDHGIDFPGMKCNLTDHGIAVALILRGPGGFTGGKVVDGMVSHVDLFPTLCDYLDIAPPPWLQGYSMMPLVRGEAEEIRDDLFAEVTYHAAYEPMRCVRTRRWKFIRRFDDRERPVLPNCGDGLSKDLWLAHGWTAQPRDAEMLFDLTFDPNEANNLADRPQYAAVLADMRARLERWMRETDDPLLQGPVPLPPYGIANHPDQRSPRDQVTLFGPEVTQPVQRC